MVPCELWVAPAGSTVLSSDQSEVMVTDVLIRIKCASRDWCTLFAPMGTGGLINLWVSQPPSLGAPQGRGTIKRPCGKQHLLFFFKEAVGKQEGAEADSAKNIVAAGPFKVRCGEGRGQLGQVKEAVEDPSPKKVGSKSMEVLRNPEALEPMD